jgi:cell division protein FtsW
VVLVPGIGRRVNGSQRWISLGFFTLQVSEFAKVFLVFYLADYFVRCEKQLSGSFKPFIKPMAVLGAVAVLLLLEPDFGTTVVILMASLAVMFVAGIPLLRFLMMMFGTLALGALAVWLEPYRLKRLTTFADPWADDVKFQSGYQLTQSLIAFGRGEWSGLGLGNSVQKLFYLPEAHTDFVFSIWAEEFGLVGVLVVMALFALLLYRALAISLFAYRHHERFVSYMAVGFAVIIGGQAFINMGVASGLLPTKGLTLPFLSYGGSSLLVCCWMVGLLLRAHWELQAMHGETHSGARAGVDA